MRVVLGGLVVIAVAITPKVAISNPAEDSGFFKGDKNRSMASLGAK
jgi:hypothetical protein